MSSSLAYPCIESCMPTRLSTPSKASPPPYTIMELFAGAGGLALGFENAGFCHLLLNDKDKWCCKTLEQNRPGWLVKQTDIAELDFTDYYDQVDIICAGVPCQPFSIAGKRLGFNDARSNVFFDYVRAIRTVRPALTIMENVKGLLHHEQGRTLKKMTALITDAGYQVLPPRLLNALHYHVPQKRERLFIIAIRNDLPDTFLWPEPHPKHYTLNDALTAGNLFTTDVPPSEGFRYSDARFRLLKPIPPGQNWRAVPYRLQKDYWGDRTLSSGVAQRLSWHKPCWTLLTRPVAGRTERCHPDETRPLTVREYARIQTFPDDWTFCGSLSSQYQQIGNAVPVNLATTIAEAIKTFLDRTRYSTGHSNEAMEANHDNHPQ